LPLTSVALTVKETHARTMSDILDVLYQPEESTTR
jgi:hypothetical protein